MFQRRLLERIEERQQETMAILRTVEAGLIASDPRTSMAAEAYNGLRKQVVAAAQERRRMLLQLAAMSKAIERGATVEDLRDMCGQWIAEAGLRRVDDPNAEPDIFDVPEGEVAPLELVAPAWVDSVTGTVVDRGLAKGVVPEPEPEPEPDPEPAVEAESEPVAAEATPEPEAKAEATEAEPEPEAKDEVPADDSDDSDDSDKTPAEERR